MRFRYLLIIPCLLLLVVINVTGSWGLADVKKQKIHSSIRLWEHDVDSYSTENWEIVHLYARQALKKDPDNPDLLSLMGNVYEWNSFQSDNQSQNEQNSLSTTERL